MTSLTLLGGQTDNHTMEIWRIPLFIVFGMGPGFLLKFLFVPIIVTRWGFVLQIGFVNTLLWAALAAGILFVKTTADRKK